MDQRKLSGSRDAEMNEAFNDELLKSSVNCSYSASMRALSSLPNVTFLYSFFLLFYSVLNNSVIFSWFLESFLLNCVHIKPI